MKCAAFTNYKKNTIMSKTNKILTFLSIFTLLVFMPSCVNDDDYSTPDPSGVQDPNIDGDRTNFQAIYSRLGQAQANGDPTAIIPADENIYIEGYVVSSDQAGNFFEEILIQNKVDDSDSMDDPRLGIRLAVNVGSLSDTYEFGRKVFVKLAGLTIGESNGVLTVAKGEGSQVEQIQEFEYRDIIIRGAEVADITPKVVPIGDLSEQDINTYIQLDNMQFNRNQLSMTYAGEPSDSFDGFRTIESCADNSTILLQTSTFADFKSVQIAQGQGSIRGVLSRDFGDDFDVFVVNSASDVDFASTERCDPIELDCGTAAAPGTTNLFNDDFESQTNSNLISGNGWTNYIEAGTEGWEAYTSGGTNASLGRSARVGSFNSSDDSSVAWLITPAINLDAQSGETLIFKTSNSFSDGSEMELLFSNDWDGTEANITSATWGVLPAAYIVQDSDFFGAWLDSGNVDLSCASGTIHIAFKYTGSGQSGMDGTYELDDISIDYTP